MIDVLGISGSPIKNGNTEILIKYALKICEDNGLKTNFVSLADKKIYPLGINENDDSKEIIDLMRNSRAIIIGSPTYFGNISANLKALFDKTLPLRKNMELRNKIGGAIAVGGSRNGGQEFTILAIHNFMLIHEMIVVSDKNTAHFGGICVGRNPGDVLNDKDGLKTVENLALKISEILKSFNI
ncbi:MAG: flavodoxin family protein [Candidatus Altarchaeaceae archaeon]